MGNSWTLSEGAERSQARWRIGGWIVTVALGLAVLVLPILAKSPMCVIATISAPSAMAPAVLLLRPAPTTHGGSGSSPLPTRVTWQRALLFIAGACVLGTNGEAVLDSAVGLTVRNSLVKGNATLALANQSAVLASMLLGKLTANLPFKPLIDTPLLSNVPVMHSEVTLSSQATFAFDIPRSF